VSLTLNFILFIILVAATSATNKLLVAELASVSLLSFGNQRPGIIFYSILTFPGTILHELSHWLTAELLQVRTGEIKLLPESDPEGKGRDRLGSVMTARTDPFRGFLIGLAPFITGLIALFSLSYLLREFWGTRPWWQIGLVLYGMIVVGNSMLISKEDRKYWPIIAIIIGLITLIIYQLKLSFSPVILTTLTTLTGQVNLVLALTIALNLVAIVASVTLRYTLQKLTGKKVVSTRR